MSKVTKNSTTVIKLKAFVSALIVALKNVAQTEVE
jgi:hypothetical protein